MESLLGLPLGASAHAAELDRMTVIVHWLMLVLFVGWGAFFAFTLLRFRKARNPVADYAGVKSHFSSYTEIGVAVIEAVLLIGFAIPAWAVRVNEFPVEAESTVVRLMARQFEWHAHYPGRDGRFGRTDIGLVTPTNAIGLDRSDPNGRRRCDDREPVESADRQAGRNPAELARRHSQLQHRRNARKTGRHPRIRDPRVVRACRDG